MSSFSAWSFSCPLTSSSEVWASPLWLTFQPPTGPAGADGPDATGAPAAVGSSAGSRFAPGRARAMLLVPPVYSSHPAVIMTTTTEMTTSGFSSTRRTRRRLCGMGYHHHAAGPLRRLPGVDLGTPEQAA